MPRKRPGIALRPPAPSAQPAPAGAPQPRPPSRLETKLIGGHFPDATWAKFSHLATDQRKSKQELLQEALDDLFAKYRAR